MKSLCSMLGKEVERLAKAEILFSVSIAESTDLYIYDYTLTEDDISKYRSEMQKEAFYQSIAKCIQEYFFKDRAHREIIVLIERDYGYFGKAEQEQIVSIADKLLKEDEEFSYFRRLSGKKMAEYLHNNKCLNINGFMCFRLKQYESMLVKLVEKSVEKFVDMVEYQEFVEVLRYFVDLNTPHAGLIHVIEHAEAYALLDEKGQILQEPGAEVFGGIKARKEEEILISSLINLAPDKIIFHQQEKRRDKETVKLLENIFKDKLTFCSGCAFCRSVGCLDRDSL